MGTFTALTGLIIPIAALTYPVAIVLPKSDRNAKGLIKLSLFVTLIIAALTMLIILLFNDVIVSTFRLNEIASFMYLIPVVIIFAGLMQVTEQWLIRTNQFAINAKANFFHSLIINGSKVGIGFIYPVAAVLVSLQAAANGLKAFMMIHFARKSDYKSSMDSLGDNINKRKLAKKHIDFPLYRAPEEFFSSLSHSLPVLLLTSFFGPASAGFYNIGRSVLALPSKLIGEAIGDVFYPRITESANKGQNVSYLIIKATSALVIIGLIPFGTVFIFGPFLFEFVFGAGWDMAGEYARWVALSSFGVFINKPSVRSMPVLSAQRFQLIFTVFRLVMSGIALIIGFAIFESDIVAVALFGSVGLLLNLILIFITLQMSIRHHHSRKS